MLECYVAAQYNNAAFAKVSTSNSNKAVNIQQMYGKIKNIIFLFILHLD